VLSPLARQIAAIGLALCAVALSLAYPLRGYLEQQTAERAAVAQRAALQQQITELQAQQAALEDPAYIRSEAKRRLQYVSPGDTVYVVKAPASSDSTDAGSAADGAGTAGSAGSTSGVAGSSGSAGSSSGGSSSGGSSSGGSASGGSAATPPWYSGLWDTLAHGTSPTR
jgi:cell division protein FtsB